MFNKEKVKLGIAPIAWTNDDMPDLGKENTFEQCVSEMALAGFTGSEVGNKYPKDPAVLKKALELRGMEICNQWFSSFLITKPFEEVEKEFRAQCEFLRAMGSKIIGASEQSHSVQGQLDTPIFGHKYVMNDEEWKTFCDGLNRLGKIAKEDYGINGLRRTRTTCWRSRATGAAQGPNGSRRRRLRGPRGRGAGKVGGLPGGGLGRRGRRAAVKLIIAVPKCAGRT